MKTIFLSLCLAICMISCTEKAATITKEAGDVTTKERSSIDIPPYDYTALKPLLHQKDDKTYVVNFWATWCVPCVKELPYFEKINREYKDKNVEVLLVSLDFPRMKKRKLIPFVAKRNLQSKVVHLDDVNEQFWIADISQSWSGALPATLIYNNSQRKFFEQSFTQQELENEIEAFIK